MGALSHLPTIHIATHDSFGKTIRNYCLGDHLTLTS